MRLWTLHPKYLDTQGLLAAWREALLAQKVLRGETKGYCHHPQLFRFRECGDPNSAIADLLSGIHAESVRRGYSFDAAKIAPSRSAVLIETSQGQLLHEWRHLLSKLEARDPERRRSFSSIEDPEPHPLFKIVPGEVAHWERA